jgi:WD40 repeat protein
VWKAATGQLIATLHGAGEFSSFSPNSRLILTTRAHGRARVWKAATGQLIATLHGAGDFSSFSPNSRLILGTNARGQPRVWKAATGQLSTILRGAGRFSSVSVVGGASFSPNGKLILITSNDLTPRIWRATPQKSIVLRERAIRRECRRGFGSQACIFTAVFSPNGAFVLTAGGRATIARLWNATTGRTMHIFRHAKTVTNAAFSPNGSLVVTASTDRTARIWDATSGQRVAVLQGHRGAVRSAEFSPNGKLVSTSSTDGTARIWDAKSGRLNAVLPGHRGPVDSVTFSPTGTRVATAGEDGTVRVWDAKSGRAISVLRPRRQLIVPSGSYVPYVRAIFSSDGKLVLAASPDGAARVWQVATGKQRAVLLPTPGDVFNSVEWSPDGHLILLASDDGRAHLWDPGSGLSTPLGSPTRGETAQARFSRDGRQLVTASTDGSRLWDVATQNPIIVLDRHFTQGATFSPNGARVVTTGLGEARIYLCPVCGSLNSLLKLARNRRGRKLTAADRRLYLHER